MTFSGVAATKKRVPATKSLSAKQMKTFIAVANSLEKKGVSEDSFIPQAISAAKRVDKSMDINKASINDQRMALGKAVKRGFIVDFDVDDSFVIVQAYDPDEDEFKLLKHSFTMDDGVADVDEEGTEVIEVGTTEFRVVEDSDVEKGFTDKIIRVLDKYFGSSRDKGLDVIKQFGTDDEPMFCIEPLYTAPLKSDGDGDMMNLEDTAYMVESLNKANDEGRLQSGLFHKHSTSTWHLEKAWLNTEECMIGDTLVPKDQPIAKTIFTNSVAFQLRKDGDISGLSIGARAKDIVDINKSASDLAALQSEPKATRQILGAHFDWSFPELTYTSKIQGGPAHLMPEPYDISKAKKAKKEDLFDEELTILKEIGEDFISLEKHLGIDEKDAPSSGNSEKTSGEDNDNLDKGNKDTMSDEKVLERLARVEKELNVEKAKNGLAKYGFEAELNKSLANAIASLTADADKEAFTEALDALVARGEEAVTKAKEAKSEGETDLQKSLGAEAGEGGESEQSLEKTLLQQIEEEQDKLNKGAK